MSTYVSDALEMTAVELLLLGTRYSKSRTISSPLTVVGIS